MRIIKRWRIFWEDKSLFLRNLITYSAADIFAKSILLIISPILTRLLTPTQFGIYSLFGALWGVISVIQYGGVDASYQFFRAQTQDEEERRIIQVTSTVLVCLSFFIIWFLFSSVSISTDMVTNYLGIDKLQLIVFLACLVPAFIVSWTTNLFRFMHLAYPYVRVNLISRIFAVALTLPFVAYAFLPQRLIVFTFVFFLLQMLSLIWIYREMKVYQVPFINKIYYSKELAKKLLGFGIKFIPSTIIYSFMFNLDRLMVGYFLPEDQVGLIGLAIQLSAGILMLKTWFSILWDPHLIEWISTKNPSFYISKLKIAITLICIVFFSITILTKVWSEPVVGIIYPDFFLSISDLLPIIALTVAFSVLSFVGIATLFIENTTKTRNTVYGLALLINFVTAYYLIPIQGVKGAVLSSLLGEVSIFISWIIIGKYVFKNLHLNWNIAILAGAGTFIFIYYFSFGSFLDPFLERMIITGGIIIINFYVGSAFLFNKKRQTE